MTTRPISFRLLIMALCALCFGCVAQPPEALPTLAALPSATIAPRVPPTLVALLPTADPGSPTPSPTTMPTDTPTPAPSPTATESPTPAPTETPTDTPSPAASPTFTVTPSLTITNTITPIPSPTFTPSPELGLLGDLAALSARATILPPEALYNPPTLTALFFAGQAFASTQGAPPGVPPLPASPAAGCPFPAPPVIPPDPALGCPAIAAPFPTISGAQSFERGLMIFMQGPPNLIYVLTFDGRFRRFEDTWRAGVDPEFLPENAPPGLSTPKRGFGKVWGSFPDVRAALGWATGEEAGSSGAFLLFERGRAVGVPVRGEVFILIDDPGSFTGTWRTIPGGL
jgi:hypothetical protein